MRQNIEELPDGAPLLLSMLRRAVMEWLSHTANVIYRNKDKTRKDGVLALRDQFLSHSYI